MTMPISCIKTNLGTIDMQGILNFITVTPNPIGISTIIVINGENKSVNYKFVVYNVQGKEVINTVLTQQTTSLDTKELHTGIYLYKVLDNNKTIQSGKLIFQQ
jgi:hypothetical protein